MPNILHPATIVVTFFGIGRLPVAPGTFGSLAAIPISWLLGTYYGTLSLLFIAAFLTILGFFATKQYVLRKRETDPSEVVIDEVIGQILTLCFVPITLPNLILGFVIFRFFDIAKPWPVSYFDREIKGAAGILLDDIIAAIMAGSLMYCLHHVMIF